MNLGIHRVSSRLDHRLFAGCGCAALIPSFQHTYGEQLFQEPFSEVIVAVSCSGGSGCGGGGSLGSSRIYRISDMVSFFDINS